MKTAGSTRERADALHIHGEQLYAEGKDFEALQKYLEAILLDPNKAESYYNIGLIYKYRSEWKKSFEYNQTANRLNPDDEAARWNLAIAATALRNWSVARRTWEECDINLDDASGPIQMNFGITPVRLNPDTSGEVVWVRRIDPVRGRITSIPFPESGFRHGDIVLHDGAAVGYRKHGKEEYPVFNVLELFERSTFETYIARVWVEDQSDLDALDEVFSATQSEFEDWSANVRPICRQCSEGTAHETHDEELRAAWTSERRLGIAIHPEESLRQLLDTWEVKSKGKVIAIERSSPAAPQTNREQI